MLIAIALRVLDPVFVFCDDLPVMLGRSFWRRVNRRSTRFVASVDLVIMVTLLIVAYAWIG